jgi:hypothetical protein
VDEKGERYDKAKKEHANHYTQELREVHGQSFLRFDPLEFGCAAQHLLAAPQDRRRVGAVNQ